jgi:hypothetical protein
LHCLSFYIRLLPTPLITLNLSYCHFGGDPIILEDGPPLTGLTLTPDCVYLKIRPGFPTSYVVVFLYVQ